MNLSEQSEQLISNSRLRMRVKSPFFATLALFAQFKSSYTIDTAVTDGKTVFYNPKYLMSLSAPEQDGLILHEVLHMALLHITRRQHRECQLWNIAADIVVNGLIAEDKNYELPPQGISKPEWETRSVEEIYELLLKEPNKFKLELLIPDLLNQPLDGPDGENNYQNKTANYVGDIESNNNLLMNSNNDNLEELLTDSIKQHHQTELKAYWQNAMQQATIVARSTSHGKLPTSIERQFKELQSAQIDWRTYLWRYLVQTPTDFQGFDRRFVSRGLYLETLIGESIQVYVCIDTSGSISDTQMNMFCSELQGILKSYPHIECQLYYADANIYGPYELTINDDIPQPIGGGGTSFIPFFEQVEKNRNLYLQRVCVYLTDGYGSFPTCKPTLPVLWFVVSGGLNIELFPFGEVVKIW